MSYTIYTLSAPAERFEWKDIRYIGMSIDIFSRFKQHLTSHDDTNPEKTLWIQGLLVHGRTAVHSHSRPRGETLEFV